MGRYVSQGDGVGDVVPSLMAYLLVAQITRDDSEATTIDTDVLDTHIETAEAEIDTFLGVRYSLPLAEVPSIIQRIAARRVRFLIYGSRPGAPEQWLVDEYDRDQRTLERIAAGKQDIGLTTSGAAPSARPRRRVTTSSVEPVFGRSNLKGY